MRTFTRRNVLKSELLAPAAIAAAQGISPIDNAIHAVTEPSGPLSPDGLASPRAGRTASK